MSGYTIASDGRWITCHTCGKTSYNINDVSARYCGHCKRFHDDAGVPIWTVYDHPRDYPEGFIARKFLSEQPTSETITAATLDEIREAMWQRGLTPLHRSPNDDPVIVETWI
jgi:hypothetical protein